MTVWRGGRGVKASYQTTHVRVPLQVKSQVEELVRAYKEGSLEESKIPSRDEAIEIAKGILKKKKSARVSLQSLLTSIYGEDISL